MSDSNRTNLTIIIVLGIVVISVGGYFTIHHFFDKKEKEEPLQEEREEKKDTSVDEKAEYESYKVGDYVTLRNNSTWNVIAKSDKEESNVLLLMEDQLDDLIDYREASNYVMDTFANDFANSMGIGTDEVSARLLSIDDIRTITGIANLEPGVTIEDSNQTFLYRSSTLTDEIEADAPILICERTNNDLAKICVGAGTNTWKVRPVIEISKKYIK